MHSALTFASLLLTTTGALATPLGHRRATSAEVRVILSSQATETGSQTVFESVNTRKHKAPVGSSGPFETIEISVGADAQQDLRCQALDLQGNPLIAVRNENVDITFSDSDNGEWTFQTPSEVSRIICDPALEQIGADALQVRVTLATDDLAVQTTFDDVSERVTLPPIGSHGPFETVEISVGELVDPALRCQVLNLNGDPIDAVRDPNVDVTFSDADKGEWTFQQPQEVSQIICDPAFVADSA